MQIDDPRQDPEPGCIHLGQAVAIYDPARGYAEGLPVEAGICQDIPADEAQGRQEAGHGEHSRVAVPCG